MLRKMNVFILLLAVAGFTSCSNAPKNNSQSQEDSSSVQANTQKTEQQHSTEKESKVYEGTLPCADCEGIQTTITLNEDSSYSLHQKYLGASDESNMDEKGDWTLNTEKNVVTLKGIKDASNQYKVTDTALIMLDMEGNEVEGALAEHYILKKK